MKNFVKHILAIAICAAALLSSCIKEENFKRDTVQLNVTLTRSSADSTQPGTGIEQGDKIEDVTLWAFSYTEVNNGFPVIADNAEAVGYRYVSGITNINIKHKFTWNSIWWNININYDRSWT